ncbi:hypothetical protein B0I26_13014 [Anoxybacillus vitaminiphilus]|uniref:Uncharacterized protein n=1 Tax=Paranoxybacillus vitaminiphilus TaxID=581036 RepID=A0A327Y1J1_9BACL|nr:hypothetical protein [Anoxybacillus vitaminiphilus]RAK14271.1 hypothetical protein B0I26_13014 [Anoxybacillus vitaminiphilus]
MVNFCTTENRDSHPKESTFVNVMHDWMKDIKQIGKREVGVERLKER